jgi:ribonuclease P protein component
MAAPIASASQPVRRPTWRLRKHADYQRLYKSSRKQFSASMTYFYATQPLTAETTRVGLTAGRVLGNAVERNRIKRRMREAVRRHLHLLPSHTDVVLHPRRSVLEIDFAELSREVERIFKKISTSRAAETSPAAHS